MLSAFLGAPAQDFSGLHKLSEKVSESTAFFCVLTSKYLKAISDADSLYVKELHYATSLSEQMTYLVDPTTLELVGDDVVAKLPDGPRQVCEALGSKDARIEPYNAVLNQLTATIHEAADLTTMAKLQAHLDSKSAQGSKTAQVLDEAAGGDEVRKRLQKVETERDKLRKRVQELQEELATGAATLANMARVLDALKMHKEAVATAKAAIATMTKEAKARDEVIARKDAQLAEKDALLTEKDAQLAEKDARLAERDAQAPEEVTQRTEADPEPAPVVDAEVGSLAKDAAASAEVTTLREQLAALQQELKDERGRMVGESRAQEEVLDRTKAELVHAQEALKEASEKVAALEGNQDQQEVLARTTGELAQAQDALAAASEKVAALQAELSGAKEQEAVNVADLGAAKEALEQAQAAAAEREQGLQKLLEAAEARAAALSAAAATGAQEQESALQARIDELTRQVGALSTELNDLRAEADSAAMEASAASEKVGDLEVQIAALNDALESCRKELEMERTRADTEAQARVGAERAHSEASERLEEAQSAALEGHEGVRLSGGEQAAAAELLRVSQRIISDQSQSLALLSHHVEQVTEMYSKLEAKAALELSVQSIVARLNAESCAIVDLNGATTTLRPGEDLVPITGANATLRNCTLRLPAGTGLRVNAPLRLENVTLWHEASAEGEECAPLLTISDAGAKVECEGVTLRDAASVACAVSGGAALVGKNLLIEAGAACAVTVDGDDSTVDIAGMRCTGGSGPVLRCCEGSGVSVSDAFIRERTGGGVMVQAGAKVKLQGGSWRVSEGPMFEVTDGGNLECAFMHFSGSARARGHHSRVEGSGALVAVKQCRFTGFHGLCISAENGADLQVEDCDLEHNTAKQGEAVLRCQGNDTVVALDRCRLSANSGAAVAISAGARGELTHCAFQRNDGQHSVIVEGRDARLTASACQFSLSSALAFAIDAHAAATVCECTFDGCRAALRASGGSRASVTSCTASACTEAAFQARGGAEVTLEGSTVAEGFSDGVSAVDLGSSLGLKSCKLRRCRDSHACATSGASISVGACEIAAGLGHGIRARGPGSCITVCSSSLVDHAMHAALAECEGALVMERVEVSRCRAYAAIAAFDASSRVQASYCTVLEAAGGLLLQSGAQASLQGCTFSALHSQAAAAVCGEQSRAQLDACTVLDCAAGAMVARAGAALDLIECNVRNVAGIGALVEDVGTRVTAKGCKFVGAVQGALKCCAGAEASLETCEAADCGGSSVAITGPGSSVELVACTINDSCEHAVSIDAGAAVSLNGCDITGARLGCGVMATGRDTTASVQDSTMQGTQLSLCCAQGGAKVTLSQSTLSQSVASSGVDVHGQGIMHASSCSISGNHKHGVLADEEATVELTNCRITHNKGCGLAMIGIGTSCRLKECKVLENARVGVAVTAGAALTAQICQIDENRVEAGVLVAGPGAAADVAKSTMIGNGLAGMLVCEGGTSHVTECKAAYCTGNGIEVHGLGSEATLKVSTLEHNDQCGALAFSGGCARLDTGCSLLSNCGPADAMAGANSLKAPGGQVLMRADVKVGGKSVEQQGGRIRAW